MERNMPKTAQFDVTILNGEAVGLPPLDLRNYQKGSIRFPSAWTAADLGFKIIGNDASEILLEDSSANVIKMTSIPTALSQSYEAGKYQHSNRG
jgi:hypothetical protein